MARRVVCISSLDGAGGEEVGRLVAERLGVRLVNEEIVARAAREAGVDTRVAADAEQSRSLIARVLRETAAGAASAPLGLHHAQGSGGHLLHDRDDLRGLIRSVIEETATEHDCVIVAHAASMALSKRVEALRVLVTASADTRSGRLAQARRLGEREASKLLKESDVGRAAYLKSVYGLHAEPATLYDLVVNTDRLSSEQAAALIFEAAASVPVAGAQT